MLNRLVTRLLDVLVGLLRREPARLLGGIAAVLTFVVSLLDAADVHTWQAALPVLLSEAIRRLVWSTQSVEAFADADIDQLLEQLSEKLGITLVAVSPDDDAPPA